MNPDQSSNPGELTDSDLNQLLGAANEELLAHIKAAADPTSTLVAIMANTAPAAPADDTTLSYNPAAWFTGGRAGRRDGDAAIPNLPTGPTAIRPAEQENYDGELADFYRKHAGKVLGVLNRQKELARRRGALHYDPYAIEQPELGLEALYIRLVPGLIRYLRQVLPHSGVLAEDIAQEAFLVLVRRWPDVRNHPNLRAWLYEVGRRLTVAALQERSRELLQEEPPDQEGAAGDDPSDGYNDSATVREAIGKLPLRQREAVWLYYFQGFKQNEIATIMQIQRGTVGALLFQARSRLAGLLGGDGG
jgi:RNA polymerase sigma factor (sigma-70 family)